MSIQLEAIPVPPQTVLEAIPVSPNIENQAVQLEVIQIIRQQE